MEVLQKALNDPSYVQMEKESAALTKFQKEFIETGDNLFDSIKWSRLDEFERGIAEKYDISHIARNFTTRKVGIVQEDSENARIFFDRPMAIYINHPSNSPVMLKKFSDSIITKRIKDLDAQLLGKRKELIDAIGGISLNQYNCSSNISIVGVTESNVYLQAQQIIQCGNESKTIETKGQPVAKSKFREFGKEESERILHQQVLPINMKLKKTSTYLTYNNVDWEED